MKYAIGALLFIGLLAGGFILWKNNKSGDKKEEKTKSYQAGDREGANSAMEDISQSEIVPKLLCQRWDNSEDDADVKAAGGTGSLDIPMRGLYLFTDGFALKDPRAGMQTGKWAYDDAEKKLQLKMDNGKTEMYKLAAIGYDEMILAGTDGKKVKYKADGFVHRDINKDPFYLPNQQWRIKPSHSETDAELLKRLKEHIRFYYLFYIDNEWRNATEISFYGLPGCFKWYAGGIHLKKEESLDPEWKAIFYDAKDAARAYVFMDKLIDKKYKWDKEEASWLRQNADVLRQMEIKMDSLQ